MPHACQQASRSSAPRAPSVPPPSRFLIPACLFPTLPSYACKSKDNQFQAVTRAPRPPVQWQKASTTRHSDHHGRLYSCQRASLRSPVSPTPTPPLPSDLPRTPCSSRPSSSSSPHPPTTTADHPPSAQNAQRYRSNGVRARPLYVRAAAARPLVPTARTNPPPPPRCHPRRRRAARPQSAQGGMKQWHPRAAARAPKDERRDAYQQAKLVLKSRSISQCGRARGGRAELYYWFGWRGRASARPPAATTCQQLKLVLQSHGRVVAAAQAARPRGVRRSCWYGMRRGGRAQTTARAAGGAFGVSAHARGA